MIPVHYTPDAELDLDEIAEYTGQTWGADQVGRYLDELEDACLRLGDHPLIGRRSDRLLAGSQRIEQGSHVIFYTPHEDRILIVRILHKRMLPTRHLS